MVLRNAGRLTEAAIMRNPVLQTLRNTVAKFAMGFPMVAHGMMDTMSEINIAYPESPLSVAGAQQAHSTKPGHRWPEPLAADTAKSRFVAIGPADAVADLAAKFPKLVEVVSSKRADPRDLILVRPDGYVGFASSAADKSGAEAYLKGLAT
jgi:hypothetical protein